jgi:hypothetical protein
MESRGRAKASISERLTDELREFVVVAIYLYILVYLAYLKASILKAEGNAFVLPETPSALTSGNCERCLHERASGADLRTHQTRWRALSPLPLIGNAGGR